MPFESFSKRIFAALGQVPRRRGGTYDRIRAQLAQQSLEQQQKVSRGGGVRMDDLSTKNFKEYLTIQ